MSGIKCVNLSKEQLKKVKDKGWHVYTNDRTKHTLSDAAINTVFTKLQSQTGNPITIVDNETFDKALTTRGAEIRQALIDAAEEQIREDTPSTGTEIEGAKLRVAANKVSFYKKNSPQLAPDTLFLFTDNLQAYLYYASKAEKAQYAALVETLSDEQYAKMLDVSEDTSATVRTVSKGSTEQTPNALGFVVKKNAYIGKHFTNEDSDQFQDSESDVFEAINTSIARKIKQMIAEKGYKTVRITKTLAGDKARLTHKNAETLRRILKDELGIESVVKSVDNSDKWFKLEVIEEVKPKSKSKAQNKKTAALKAALESLKKKAPEQDLQALEANREALRSSNRDVLATTYPDISERRARVNYLLELFRTQLTEFMDDHIANLERMREEDPEQFYSVIAGNRKTYQDVLDGLTKGSPAENRIFALRDLRAITEDNKEQNVATYLFNKIYDDIHNEVEVAFETPDAESPKDEWVEAFADDVLLNEEHELGEIFLQECEDKNWHGQRAKKEARMRARYLAYEYRKMLKDDVYEALWEDMKFDLESIENIHIEKLGRVSNSQSDEQNDEMSEGKSDTNKEGYMIKYRLLNPKDTASVRMKNLLSTLFKTKTNKGGKVVHVYDDMGRPIRVSSGEAYYTILEAFENVITEDDLDGVMADLVQRHPWLWSLYPRICELEGYEKEFDFDLRKEFYTTFFQAPIKYIKMHGSYFVFCNKDADVATFLKRTSNNIEGHIVLGSKSIYDEDGRIVLSNVQAINKMFEHGKTLDTVLKKLRGVTTGASSVVDIDSALTTLRENDLLKDLLNSIGISTDAIDLDLLMPARDLDEYKSVYGYDMKSYLEDVGEKNIQALVKVLTQIQIITRSGDGIDESTVLREGDIPTVKFQKAYTIIGGALKEPSDGYTNQTFRGPDGNDRFSYTSPDFISLMTRAISREDAEKARQYIIENWGDCDYFRDQSMPDYHYGWRNVWLADFMKDEADTENWRVDFEALQLLSMLDEDGEVVAIKDVQERDLLANLFIAYRGSTSSNSGATLAYYRNPLFSDVDAIMLFKGRRYSGEGYQERIADNLVEVFEQEYNLSLIHI